MKKMQSLSLQQIPSSQNVLNDFASEEIAYVGFATKQYRDVLVCVLAVFLISLVVHNAQHNNYSANFYGRTN